MESIQEKEYSYFEEVYTSSLYYSASTIAKELGMGARALNKLLYQARIIHPFQDHWKLSPSYRDQGYEYYKRYTYFDNSHKMGSRIQLYWTEKGRKFICEFVKSLPPTTQTLF
jgi:phage antirepressor YoqD-like protein